MYVSQGSVLRPLLFIIYINKMQEFLRNSSVSLYAGNLYVIHYEQHFLYMAFVLIDLN